ncbi:MAG: SCO4226 family nickel-binding protein [Deltaproteobacteria bacterium]|nr:SCO4226 family nickel-binding protein [Deltaproteobacteria bacterium]
MAKFIDIHSGMTNITQEQLEQAHREDQKHEGKEGVRFIKAWADPQSGKVFCLSEGPDKEAVKRVHQKAGHPADEIYEVKHTTE